MQQHIFRLSLILFLIIICEIILTFGMGVNQRPLYETHSRIEYMLKPNQELTRFGNKYIVNEYGMRSSNFPKDFNSPDKLKIMVIGDSIINGGTKLGQHEIATTILEDRLIAQGFNTYVGNISAGSWGPENVLEYIKEYGTFNADIVIVLVSSHDLLDVPSFEQLSPQTHPTSHNQYSLYEIYLKYFSPSLKQSLQKEVRFKRESILRNGENDKLTELLQLLKGETDYVAVITHNTRDEISSSNREIKGLIKSCSNTKVECIDTLVAYKDAQSKENLYFDNLHLNAEGQKVLSSVMYEVIHAHLLQNQTP